jgi:hypothetical protein
MVFWVSRIPPAGEELLRPSRAWLLAIPSAYAVAVAGSVLYGTPVKLPGTSRGELPTQFGNVAYPAAGRQQELARRVAELDQRLERRLVPLEEGKQTNDEALPLITSELTELSSRLNAVESRRGD